MAESFDRRAPVPAASPAEPDAPARTPVYLAAALGILLGVSLTAIAVWQLDDSDSGGRLAAVPWRCCLADR